ESHAVEDSPSAVVVHFPSAFFVEGCELQFSQTDEVSCVPYFKSTLSWGLFRNRTKLQCRKCGNRIGSSYEEGLSSPSLQSDNSESSSSNGSGNSKKYMIKISKLQPSDDSGGYGRATPSITPHRLSLSTSRRLSSSRDVSYRYSSLLLDSSDRLAMVA
ncbi:hypothetical protein HPP92_018104, partial [Vanilla planifolia]